MIVKIIFEEFYAAHSHLWQALQSMDTNDWRNVVIFTIGTYGLTLICAAILSSKPSNLSKYYICEACVVPILYFPWILKGAPIRMGMGLHNFMYALYINGRVMEWINSIQLTHHHKPSTFLDEALSMYGYFVYPFLQRLSPKASRWPTNQQWIRFLITYCIWDGLIFLLREVISDYIHPSNQIVFVALIGGIWVVYCIDLVYQLVFLLCQGMGQIIPLEMIHLHPLLSSSMAEFWGARWNPFIGKLLQFSIYKPLCYFFPKLSRSWKMTLCFAMSAVLHAYPQLQSTCSWKDSLSMLLFFLLQGVGMVIEPLVLRWIGSLIRAYSMKEMTRYEKLCHHPSTPCTKTLSLQSITEALIMLTVLTIAYIHWEMQWSLPWILLAMLLAACSLLAIWRLQLGYFHLLVVGKHLETSDRWPFVWYRLVGWAFMMVMVLGTLPLFALPMLSATEELYAHSLVVGPTLRILSRVLGDNS